MKTVIFFIISIANMIFGILYRYPSAIIFGALALAVSLIFLFEKDARNNTQKFVKEEECETSN